MPTFYGVALGSFVQTFTFTNASHRACALAGWPRLALENRSRVTTRRVRQGAPTAPAFRTVVLRPRGVASFDVYGEDWNHQEDKPCPKTTRIRITPPGARSALSVAVKMPNCGLFLVAPVIAGKTDRQAWSMVETPPVLGHAWSSNTVGYGRARPPTVFNGGDPTGLVRHIRWTGWGSRKAVGSGISTYVWPGTGVANNGPVRGARIVAFHFGTCRGRPSYNAVEWYFPRYGERFDPHRYIDACTGAEVGFDTRPAPCANVPLAHGRTAKDIEVQHMSCARAERLITAAPIARYLKPAVARFMVSGFRCGTTGIGVGGAANFACELGPSEVVFYVVA